MFAHDSRYGITADDEIYRTEGGWDVIADFAKGQDRLRFVVDPRPYEFRAEQPDGAILSGFRDLGSNGNGALDDGDRYVAIERVAQGGATRLSTVIDVSDFAGQEEALVVFGVTGLGAADFVA